MPNAKLSPKSQFLNFKYAYAKDGIRNNVHVLTITHDEILTAFQSSDLSKKYNRTVTAVKTTDEIKIAIFFIYFIIG